MFTIQMSLDEVAEMVSATRRAIAFKQELLEGYGVIDEECAKIWQRDIARLEGMLAKLDLDVLLGITN